MFSYRSQQFKAFVKRCLVKNPEERASASELLEVSSVSMVPEEHLTLIRLYSTYIYIESRIGTICEQIPSLI